MNLSRSVLINLFILCCFCSYSQQIENVDFTVKDNVVVVTYDLVNCPSRESYDIELKIISDNTIKPNSITGDLKKVSAGKNKKIEWNVLDDKSDLKGQIQVILEIEHAYSTKIIGGPSNAVFSMLLPGLGDHFVNKESKSWYYISALYLGTAYYAYSNKVQSDEFYAQYHSSTTQSEIEAAYKSANDKYHNYQLLLGVAGTIWLADVIHVTAKGFKNRRNQLNGYSQANPKVKLYLAGTHNNFQVRLVKKF